MARRAADDPPVVTLGAAINMASIAMEAYLTPTAGRQYGRLGANDTTTQYLSRSFVETHFQALLKVTVKTASGFKGADVRLWASFTVTWCNPACYRYIYYTACRARTSRPYML